MEFDELCVHTMTCTCRSGVRVSDGDLEALCATVPLRDGIMFCTSPLGLRRGPVPDKRGRPFGYNASFGVTVAEQARPVHVKLFSSGTMQIAGSLTLAAAYAAAKTVSSSCGQGVSPVDLVVHMINAGTRAPQPLDLKACYSLVRASGLVVSYDPCRYSALKTSVFFGQADSPETQDGVCRCASPCVAKSSRHRMCHMVTISVFGSGAVGATGGGTLRHLERALELVASSFRDAPEARQRDAAAVLQELRRLKGRAA